MFDAPQLPSTLSGWLYGLLYYATLPAVLAALTGYFLARRKLPSEISLNLGQSKKAEAEARQIDRESDISLVESLEESVVKASGRWKAAETEIDSLIGQLRDMRKVLAEIEVQFKIVTSERNLLQEQLDALNLEYKLLLKTGTLRGDGK